MSFTRLRRSSIYPKVIQIYEQVKDNNFLFQTSRVIPYGYK